MDPVFAVAGGVAVLIAGVAAIAAWSPEGRLRRAIAGARQATVADAPEGVPVRLVGLIVADEVIEAPLSDRACVYYRLECISAPPPARTYMIRRRRPRRAHEERAVGFTLDDGTGVALVDPRGARVAAAFSARDMVRGKPTERQVRLFRQLGIGGRGSLLRERILAPGQRVVIRGVAVREPDPDGAARATGYRGDSPTRLRLAGTPEHPLLVAEHDEARPADPPVD